MPGPGSPKKLLIVDDERDLVEPLLLRLRASGAWEVSAAFDGDDGFRKALIEEPDVALIDLAMPELDGWGLCRRLREHPRTRRTRVVIMTAWTTRDLERRARAEGVARVLLKPFDEAVLFEALGGAGIDILPKT